MTPNVNEKPAAVIKKGKKRKADEDLEPEAASANKSQPPPPSTTVVSPKSDIVAAFLKRVNNKKFQIPRRADGSQHDTNGSGASAPPRSVTPGTPMYDANREGALVLPRPPPGHTLYTDKLVDVVVDPCLGLKLRPHQRNGVIFMYR